MGTTVNRLLICVAMLAQAAVLLVGPAASAEKAFKNCTAVRKVYAHGIARSARAARLADGLTGRPFISARLYAANRSKDRDKDGVACEK